MRRRDFMKGLGALSITLGFGAKKYVTDVSREDIDKYGDQVIQEGADRGVYSQELADEIISGTTTDARITLNDVEQVRPKGDISFDTVKPQSVYEELRYVQGVVRCDWSSYLDEFLDEGIHVVSVPCCDSVTVPAKVTFDKSTLDRSVISHEFAASRHELKHLYVSYQVPDNCRSGMKGNDLVDLYFMPALKELSRFINDEAKGKTLYVSPFSDTYGAISSQTNTGKVPVRVTATPDHCRQSTRVDMECRVIAV